MTQLGEPTMSPEEEAAWIARMSGRRGAPTAAPRPARTGSAETAPRTPQKRAVTPEGCPPHHWRIDEPTGGRWSRGVCLRCGAEKQHPNVYVADMEGAYGRLLRGQGREK